MKIRIIKAASKKDMAIIRCFLIVVCFCFLIFASLVIKNICMAISANNSESPNLPKTIIIDPGHGGEDGGAVGYNGVVEKGINLDISLKLRDLFKSSGFNVIMTREDDSAIYDSGCSTLRQKKVSDIHNRSKIIENNPDCIFISIHQNKFEQSKYSGTQVFYSKNNELSKQIADCIQNQVKLSLQPDNDRVIKPAGNNLYILYHSKAPSVMVECGFLSNPTESQKLVSSEYQEQMAFSIYCGTLEYFSGKGQQETN